MQESQIKKLLKEKKIFRLLGIVLIIEVAGSFFIPDLWFLRIFMIANVYCLYSISWDIQWSYTAQPNFGAALFFGGAAYASSLFNLHFDIPIIFSMILGIASFLIVALLVGYPLLRLRGVYFAIFTLFLPIAIMGVVYMFPVELGGDAGLAGVDTFASDSPRIQFLIVTIIMALSTCIIVLIGHSDLGLIMKSMKENELGAASSGVNIAKYKIIGFVISAGFMALAGVMYVHTLGVIGPVLLAVTTSVMPIVMAYVGGVGTLTGALIGAYLISFLSEYFLLVPALRILIYSVVLVLILRFFPTGIMGFVERFRTNIS